MTELWQGLTAAKLLHLKFDDLSEHVKAGHLAMLPIAEALFSYRRSCPLPRTARRWPRCTAAAPCEGVERDQGEEEGELVFEHLVVQQQRRLRRSCCRPT